MDTRPADGYGSPSQRVRMITEAWAGSNLYCAACDADGVEQARNNARAVDFTCPACGAPYQLKAFKRWDGRRVMDAAYAAMMEAVRGDRTPNLLVLHYTPDWWVQNLLLVPCFFFAESAIEQRNPLRETARRAGHVLCNIRLDRIAPEGKIRVVNAGVETAPVAVRTQYARVRPLAQVSASLRGWALDVYRMASDLGPGEFTLPQVYAFEHELAALHPKNRYVRAKIRQQLQVLRDAGLLEFVSSGRYRLV